MNEFRITKLGVYLTRDGEEVEITDSDPGSVHPWVSDWGGTWASNGEWQYGNTSHLDLVKFVRPFSDTKETNQ